MDTKILAIDDSSLALSKKIIQSGGVVAFPTETVYGLGANAFDDGAVRSIFAIKGRPADNPLIVHVHKDYDINTLVSYIPEYAKLLAKVFLPGPLTMVYRSHNRVSAAVSCGLDTLAIRIPSHEGAQRFLRYLDLPIAAPSANVSKHVSPVTARHVYDDLKGKIELVLDGGKCNGGIESTVLDCTGEIPCVLRSGLVTADMIAQVAGECHEYVMKEGEKVRSPGMKYKHYSPNCRTALFEYADRAAAFEEYRKLKAEGKRVCFMAESAVLREFMPEDALDLGATDREIASNLYDKLREGERIAEIIVGVVPCKQDGVMVGVMNRMRKAFG